MMKKRLSLYILSFLLSFGAIAQEPGTIKEEADSAFAKENYQEAVELYSQIAAQTVSADVYYNLGCAYYRLDSIAQSVLCFERAAKYNPGDRDVRFNLDLARSKTVDKISVKHDMIIVTLFRSLVNMMDVQSWTRLSMVLYALFFVALGVYFIARKTSVKKVGFFTTAFFAVLLVFCVICAFKQKEYLQDNSRGIVMASSITVRSTPMESGNELFILHEGARVKVLDNSLKDWAEVEIDDGKIGWLPKSAYELI